MRLNRRIFTIALLLTLLPLVSLSQELPSLGVASNIKSGKFANGISYYIATNNTEKGRVDIALVQKVGTLDEEASTAAETIVRSRESITDLPRFTQSSPFVFLSRSGILPSQYGYVHVFDDATIYNFKNINTAATAVDSTLLLVFDIIASREGPLKDSYNPANQAIVIAGDVDANALTVKMDMLSMLIPESESLPGSNRSSKAINTKPVIPASPQVATFNLCFSSPRIEQSAMNTVLPVVTEKLAAEFGIILKKRINEAFRDNNIPSSPIRYEYVSSSESFGDEQYHISVSTSVKTAAQAAKVLAKLLVKLDLNGVSSDEYSMTQSEYMFDMNADASTKPAYNSDLVRSCVSSFLYGSSLANAKSKADFFLYKVVDLEQSTALFNSFIASVIEKSRLNYSISNDYEQDVNGEFESAWKAAAAVKDKQEKYFLGELETVVRRGAQKSKLKTDIAEPLSGGRIWTFANGIRVIYKNNNTAGDIFHYSWLIKGGYASLQDIQPNEGAFVSDLLWCNRFNNIEGCHFNELLRASGIKLSAKVSISDLRLEGLAQKDDLTLLLKSLLTIANDRTADFNAYDYFVKSEILTLEEAGKDKMWRKAVMDSLMFSGTTYSPYKLPVNLSSSFFKRAQNYYDGQFAKMNDGVLVIVGNFNEEDLKKSLSQYIGGFKTERVANYRINAKQTAITGSRTKYCESDVPTIDLSYSAPINLTAENLLAAYIATAEIKDNLAVAVANHGWYVDSDFDNRLFPEERLITDLYLRPSNYRGFPGYMLVSDSVDIVSTEANRAFRKLAENGISSSALSSKKSLLVNNVSNWASSPKNIIDLIIYRYAYGKDFMTRIQDKANGISANTVNAIIKALYEGSKVEYSVEKKYVPEVVDEPQIDMPSIEVEKVEVAPSDTTGFVSLYNQLFLRDE